MSVYRTIGPLVFKKIPVWSFVLHQQMNILVPNGEVLVHQFLLMPDFENHPISAL